MSDIVLAALNAKYIHASFGLRYLYANMGDLQDATTLLEFTINERPVDIAEKILAASPKIVGLGCYIWNVEPALELVSILKRIAPEITVVLGGPEVSYETNDQPLAQSGDYVICGEGDVAFPELCRAILADTPPPAPIIRPPVTDVATLVSPYAFYSDEDIAHRVIYVEASRGCPFRCEFCLSSLDKTVRTFPLEAFLNEMQMLLDRGVTQFKFVDRTFNLKVETSLAILNFFHERWQPGIFVHFELIPDRLPDPLRDAIAAFPENALQFEVGIQTFDPDTAKRISRRQNYEKLHANFEFLDTHSTVHVHADLIVGLPGEGVESFGRGFDTLVGLNPEEIQVGVLKRLRGTPIIRHDDEHQMVYSSHPPYEILSTGQISFAQMQRMKRFARFWDIVANSGNFQESVQMLWHDCSPFDAFMAFSDWLFSTDARTSGIALTRIVERMLFYLVEHKGLDQVTVAEALVRDYRRAGRPKVPKVLRDLVDVQPFVAKDANLPKRQARHAE